ncbi:hypothetical protein [Aeromonas caviae]|uniref:hypothetical protein n=1 Tax=Aeromonas caviae TaxID=648 RepID=UPI002B479875|nr:hypothetical protein [Aeromonas caviae]
MLNKDDVYDRRIIKDIPRMPAGMRVAFLVSDKLCYFGVLLSHGFMAAFIITFGFLCFGDNEGMFVDNPLAKKILWFLIGMILARVIPFLFSAIIRIWYYKKRNTFQ